MEMKKSEIELYVINILQRVRLWWKMVWSFAADKFTRILWFEPRWTHFWCPHSMAKRCTMLRKITGQFFLWIGPTYLKFIYSEKATKFCEIFTLLLTVCTVVKSKVKILQNFVAFSEYMNFKEKEINSKF